ncbi:MAG: FAD-dependent oxidoreductase [Lentisphaeria bacterium]|jgi:hypothetical protein
MTMKTITEPSRTLPVVAEPEVLVAGAGPAGIGAALAAARAGAKTMLLEKTNAIGGMATSGMMSHWSGARQTPLMLEVIERMRQSKSLPLEFNPLPESDSKWCISHECQKTTLGQMMCEAGVTVQLHTTVADVIMDGNRIQGVITESKSGREAILAQVTIDATGDGDVAARAGAEYILGREEDNACQPVTLMFRIGGVDYSRAVFPGSFESYMDIPKGEIQALGKQHLPHPAGHVLLYRTRLPGEVCVNMTNVTNIDGTDVRQLTKAEFICREQMDAIVEFLREFVPGYERCYLVAAADNVGVRETRHFKGVTTITPEDIVEARVFPDWIATKNYFNFDIHSVVGPGLDKNGAQREFRAKGSYTIPYGACVPEKIDGLLLSGRNISGTHKAHSNFRVMGICLGIGQGVGIAAATAVRQGVLPRHVDVAEVQRQLRAVGVTP